MQDTIRNRSHQRYESLKQAVYDYYQLTKPRIIPLLLIETAAGMWVAAEGRVSFWLLIVTLVSGTLAAASAQTINCVYDQDIDYEMKRTRHRPLPSGRIQPRNALIFAGVLAILSFSLLTGFANLLSALLAMAGIAIYIGVYTHWLKRSSTQNIVIGGAAGAIPPLVGWAAVTGTLPLAAWLLFAIVFVWTPPHFWALALVIQEDYAQVNVPMLPVVAGDEATTRQIFAYTLALVPITLLMVYPLHVLGWVYASLALLLGTVFIQKAWDLMQAPGDRDQARSLFKYSILYMMALSAGMVLDSLPLTHQFTGLVATQLQGLLG